MIPNVNSQVRDRPSAAECPNRIGRQSALGSDCALTKVKEQAQIICMGRA